MIATCSTCRKMFETSNEDAYTPGVTCAACYASDLAALDLAALDLAAGDLAAVCMAFGIDAGPSRLEVNRG